MASFSSGTFTGGRGSPLAGGILRSRMARDLIVVMNVTDPAGYDRYRAAMKPILARYGGSFRYDFLIGQTLASASAHAITRVFVLSFPEKDAEAAFFANPEYLAVRAKHFAPAVDGFTVLGEIERQEAC